MRALSAAPAWKTGFRQDKGIGGVEAAPGPAARRQRPLPGGQASLTPAAVDRRTGPVPSRAVARTDELRGAIERIEHGDSREALQAVAHMREALSAIETELAADGLREGLSWAKIGAALGITKQAAHRRHSRSVASLDRAAGTHRSGGQVIVAEEARLAVQLARDEAVALGRRTLGTEHLLLGVLRALDLRAARALRTLGITVERAREAVEPTVEDSTAGASRGQGPPVVSRRARTILEDALRDRAERGSGTVGIKDLLLALVREREGGAARTLRALGVTPDEVSRELAAV
jgi:hypothetical protein